MVFTSRLIPLALSAALLLSTFFSETLAQNPPCRNDDRFRFGSFIWTKATGEKVRVIQTCAWLTENNALIEKRTNDWCNYRNGLGQLVKDKCPIPCRTCPSVGQIDPSKCQNRPMNWKDQDGNSCDYYDSDSPGECSEGRDPITGRSAFDACCSCSGGCINIELLLRGMPPDADPIPWNDNRGQFFNCEWYARDPMRCRILGGSYKNNGFFPRDACCSCGGGEPNPLRKNLN